MYPAQLAWSWAWHRNPCNILNWIRWVQIEHLIACDYRQTLVCLKDSPDQKILSSLSSRHSSENPITQCLSPQLRMAHNVTPDAYYPSAFAPYNKQHLSKSALSLEYNIKPQRQTRKYGPCFSCVESPVLKQTNLFRNSPPVQSLRLIAQPMTPKVTMTQQSHLYE